MRGRPARHTWATPRGQWQRANHFGRAAHQDITSYGRSDREERLYTCRSGSAPQLPSSHLISPCLVAGARLLYSSTQPQQHRRSCARRGGLQSGMKGKPTHPAGVDPWGHANDSRQSSTPPSTRDREYAARSLIAFLVNPMSNEQSHYLKEQRFAS